MAAMRPDFPAERPDFPAEYHGAMRVLIVDDNHEARTVVRAVLERRGHVVIAEADNGKDAVAATTQSEPDVVLVDVRLGEESGYDVAKALTSTRPGLAVLLMSVDSHASTELAGASGARGLVVKHRLHTIDLAVLCARSEERTL
jgi:CheY-like chemotaxis protein